MRIRELEGLGQKSELMLSNIGIETVEEFLRQDPFEIYKMLKVSDKSISLNMLYAVIGAQEGKKWQEVARERRVDILMRLDDMGLAP